MEWDTSISASEFDRQLFEIELRIARRADYLASILGQPVGHSFELWRQAEAEIWPHYHVTSPAKPTLYEFAPVLL